MIGTTYFQIGPDSEKDVVKVETLLMKLALATQTIKALAEYTEHVEANEGQAAEYHAPPDAWAITGTLQNLYEISQALKAGCWGYQEAHLH